MSVNLSYRSEISVAETLETNVPAALEENRVVVHDQFDSLHALTATTTPPVSKCAFFEKQLSSGVGTIDLTAMPGTNGAAVDGTGLRIRAAKFHADSGNGAAITIAKGASNGYAILGAGTSITLAAGQEILIYLADGAPAIGSGARTLDLTGSGSDHLHVSVVMG